MKKKVTKILAGPSPPPHLDKIQKNSYFFLGNLPLRFHLGVGLRFLHRLLLWLGEGGVHTGNDLLAPLDHQSQVVARLPHQLLRLLVVQLEHVAAADLDQVVAGLGSRVGRNAVKRNL